jgi:hypothetical protein
VFVKLGYCVEDPEACARATLRIVLVGLGVAEECHHAVAEILSDMPAEALDGLRRRSMIVGNDFAPLLGIEMAGDLGRADQIAEKHGQMPPLTFDLVLVDNDVVRILLRFGFGRDNEPRTAVTTEAGAGRILRAALWAADTERNTAANAEFLARGVIELAA